ncbi:MAG TPA: CU044_2847 family protein [Longimicrobium sp.]|nr:CU044_2847 family protein [Longimicrobium sp.]
MPRYVEFTAADGSSLLVEVPGSATPSPGSTVRAGAVDRVADAATGAVVRAQGRFEEMINTAVRQNARAFVDSVMGLPQPPDEVEVSFGLVVTGELGNAAVCKAGGEANYTVKLVWNRLREGEAPDRRRGSGV